MKCPKCGFVSYAGLEQCKKCGYAFVKATPKGSPPRVTTLFPAGVRLDSIHRPEPIVTPKMDDAGPGEAMPAAQPTPPPLTPAETSSFPPTAPAAEPVLVDETSQDWRDELSQRVDSFRRRRARLHPDTESEGNLELDFEESPQPEARPRPLLDDSPWVSEGERSGLDLEIGDSSGIPGGEGLSGAALSLEESRRETMQFDVSSPEAAEFPPDETLAQGPPMEIQVESPVETRPKEDRGASGIIPARLGRRILAGLTDAFVLILGAAVFGIILWRVCGRLSMVPLNIVVLAGVAVMLIFAYFAVFTAIAAATPGLLWMGCEIRNLYGGPPTIRESCWRALGVLVSLSALMVGFLWSCVDSDTLTWHDRMSGTVITEIPNVPDLADVEATT